MHFSTTDHAFKSLMSFTLECPREVVFADGSRATQKGRKIWSHFSLFEVWDNIDEAEIAELEGLFREIYRKDKRANRFNRQKKCKAIQTVREDDFSNWKGRGW
jgi:hypothetical protein